MKLPWYVTSTFVSPRGGPHDHDWPKQGSATDMAAMTTIKESRMLLMPEVGKGNCRECSDVSLNVERNKDVFVESLKLACRTFWPRALLLILHCVVKDPQYLVILFGFERAAKLLVCGGQLIVIRLI